MWLTIALLFFCCSSGAQRALSSFFSRTARCCPHDLAPLRYVGLPKEHPESYWSFMHTNLFDHIDIKVRFLLPPAWPD